MTPSADDSANCDLFDALRLLRASRLTTFGVAGMCDMRPGTGLFFGGGPGGRRGYHIDISRSFFGGRRRVHMGVKMGTSVNLRNHAIDKDARRMTFDISSDATNFYRTKHRSANMLRVPIIPIIVPQKAV